MQMLMDFHNDHMKQSKKIMSDPFVMVYYLRIQDK